MKFLGAIFLILLPLTYSTPSPTFFPTSVCTQSSANSRTDFLCDAFSATLTNAAQQNTGFCNICACPGQMINVESCNTSPSESYCEGDTVFRLMNTLTGAQATANDDGCGATGSCSALSYKVPYTTSCQNFLLKEGCYGSRTCAGRVRVTLQPYTNSPTLKPTFAPSRVPFSTASPTLGLSQPTLLPTRSPTTIPTSTAASTPPSRVPTASSVVPTRSPSRVPTGSSVVPTRFPSRVPTASSVVPTRFPSRVPTASSVVPTRFPSRVPTASSVVPTRFPSRVPTTLSSGSPSRSPSRIPSRVPTRSPSRIPSRVPTRSPSRIPSRVPTRSPSRIPT